MRKRERIGRRDSSCSRCVAEAGDCSRMKIAFRRYSRARPVRSLVDLISYAELSSRSMQVAPLPPSLPSLFRSFSFYSGSSFSATFRYHRCIASCGSTSIGSEKSNLQLTGNFLRLFCAPNHRIVRYFSRRITWRWAIDWQKTAFPLFYLVLETIFYGRIA